MESLVASGDDELVVPDWVVHMREAGYDVRMGMGGALPEEPEVAFTLQSCSGNRMSHGISFGRTSAREQMMARPSVIHSDPEILGGTPVFVGTRVPLKNLIDYLEGGHPLDDFLDDFPTVTREQVLSVLDEAQEALSERARAA
jgi:uncharacterized protein (DUF433 family)